MSASAGGRMLKTDQTVPRVLAVLVGAALFFILPLALGALLGDETPLMLPAHAAAYGVSGVLFGLRWPEGGWRLGLYLLAVWPPMLLFAILLGGEVLLEGKWAGVLRELLEFVAVLVAACFGAEVGAIIGRRRRSDSAASA